MLAEIRKAKPGRPKGIVPVAFTAEDDMCLVRYMAETTTHHGKTGLNYYIAMVENLKGTPETMWVTRHPPAGWQNRYSKNRARFNEEIAKYLNLPQGSYDDPNDQSRLPPFRETFSVLAGGEAGTVDGVSDRNEGTSNVRRVLDHPQSRMRLRSTREGSQEPSTVVRPQPKRRKRKAEQAPPPEFDVEDQRAMSLYALKALASEVALQEADVYRIFDFTQGKFVQTQMMCYEFAHMADRLKISVGVVFDAGLRMGFDLSKTEDMLRSDGGEINGRTPQPDGGPVAIQPGLE